MRRKLHHTPTYFLSLSPISPTLDHHHGPRRVVRSSLNARRCSIRQMKESTPNDPPLRLFFFHQHQPPHLFNLDATHRHGKLQVPGGVQRIVTADTRGAEEGGSMSLVRKPRPSSRCCSASNGSRWTQSPGTGQRSCCANRRSRAGPRPLKR